MKRVAFVLLLICTIFSIQAQDTSSDTVQVTARGGFWATRYVNMARYEIELTVIFNGKTGEIIHINYVPSATHSTNFRYHIRWTTAERSSPGTFRDYITALTGMRAENVAQFTKPTGHARGGNHGIASLNMSGVDAISGATETGRNLVSSVVAASQIFMAQQARRSNEL